MTRVQEIYEFIDTKAPFSTALSFDNVGLLVGDQDHFVEKCLVSLDITRSVIEEAAEYGAQLIVSHHPVIFDSIFALSKQHPAYWLAKYEIAAICAHTNFDMAQQGVNYWLARRLQLQNVRAGACEDTGLPQSLMGELREPMDSDVFANYVKQRLNCGGVKYTKGTQTIQTVGLCSGSGADFLEVSCTLGAQAFVTGETKHHQLISAKEMGITLVDAGHFCTEDIAMEPLKEMLAAAFPNVLFEKSGQQDPVNYL